MYHISMMHEEGVLLHHIIFKVFFDASFMTSENFIGIREMLIFFTMDEAK